MFPSRLRPLVVPKVLFGFCFLSFWQTDGFSQEIISPGPQTPQAIEPGLSSRAIPTPPPPDYDAIQGNYVPLKRLINPYYDNVFAIPPPESYEPPDPSTFRDVLAFEPPLGLQPTFPKPGFFTLSPFTEVTETYDSNLYLTPGHHVGDSYTTLAAGTDFQLGSPDSTHTEGYDSILALHGHYLFSADIFSQQEQLNAINNRLNLDGRIGRDEYIWRPYLNMEQFTSTDFEDRNTETIGRLQRQILSPGVEASYQFDPNIIYTQNFSWTHLEHPETGYIDTDQWNLLHDFGYRVRDDFELFVWNDLRQTEPSTGAAANELMGGVGWRGKLDPRLFTELRIGWDAMEFSDDDPARRSLSGWRMGGHTSFDWSDRFRLSLKYDRNYTYNEVVENDNYVASVVQLVPEFFLGGNFYLTPYIAITDYSYETERLEQIEYRAETELAYRFNPTLESDSRVYIKGGYLRTDQIHGEPNQPTIEDVRISMGIAFKF